MALVDHMSEGSPSNCPGTSSEQAGKADACAGCPNQSTCATAPRGPDPDLELIEENLSGVRHRILVLSGKGGVGKSTVSSTLARSLAYADPNRQVALLDVDICGPSQPLMMGLEGEQMHYSQHGWDPVMTGEHGNLAVCSVGFLLEDQSDALIWRGPRKNGLMKQFLRDVQWGPSVDFLLVDTPPGTSDEHLTLAQLLKPISGAILVTTPQEIAWQDVRKEIDFCQKVKIPILGIIENMAEFICPNCRNPSDIFERDEDADGLSRVHRYARDHGIPYLGSIPMDPRIGMALDEGRFLFEALEGDSPVVAAYTNIVNSIISLTNLE